MFIIGIFKRISMRNTILLFVVTVFVKSAPRNGDLYLWIDEQQVKMFSGISMEIYAIMDGHVLPYILDPNFEKHLPIIPSEVGYVNFTWKSGTKKYYYNFDRLQSFDEAVLEPPVISIKTKGRVPRKPKVFSVFLPCSGNNSGIASFGIGLLIESRKGKPLPGTPLRLRLRKECAQRGPDPECDKKCANGGWCNYEKICQCPEGYMGQYCKTALCYPQCMNGGSCTAPGMCSCPIGFQGRHCEGGICAEKCQNGGKCIQKDTCECSKGYYGLRCEFSKCIIPCLNGGRCRGVNKCRCPTGYMGDHCEIGRHVPARSTCTKPCRHGTCRPDNTCVCDPGWYGKLCHQKAPQMRNRSRVRR
ncbi:protein shifted isoform X1 [Cryptotermes secundus]|uniref:protein shifted isoform X1 n=2 Tax=Cryptotermes secundus TaxID=105785 RepID=UPI000CD7CF39|nr:protein shifted isoform X1 [Cryptotermes secundus]